MTPISKESAAISCESNDFRTPYAKCLAVPLRGLIVSRISRLFRGLRLRGPIRSGLRL